MNASSGHLAIMGFHAALLQKRRLIDIFTRVIERLKVPPAQDLIAELIILFLSVISKTTSSFVEVFLNSDKDIKMFYFCATGWKSSSGASRHVQRSPPLSESRGGRQRV